MTEYILLYRYVGIAYTVLISQQGLRSCWYFYILKIVFKIGNYFKPMNNFFLETKLEFVKLFFFFFFLRTYLPLSLSLFQVAEMTEELATLPKRAQLAAAFITYLSAAPEGLRKTCLEEWTKSAGLESLYLVNS